MSAFGIITDDKPRCRVCGKAVRPTLNEDAGSHRDSYGARCSGSGRPLLGEPPCNDRCGYMPGRVSYPADLDPGHKGPSASTYVCADPKHQAEAANWVREITGQPGAYADLPRGGVRL